MKIGEILGERVVIATSEHFNPDEEHVPSGWWLVCTIGKPTNPPRPTYVVSWIKPGTDGDGYLGHTYSTIGGAETFLGAAEMFDAKIFANPPKDNK